MSIYSVPLWQSEYPEFEEHKEIFLSSVKEYKEQNPTKETPRSNIAGYQSPNTLQGVEELRPLFEYICQILMKIWYLTHTENIKFGSRNNMSH